MNAAAVELNSSPGDRQAEAHTTTGAIPIGLYAVKRIEQPRQTCFRRTWAMIPNGDNCFAFLASDGEVYAGIRGSIANRVSHYVLERAVEQFRVALDAQSLRIRDREYAGPLVGF